MIAAITSCTNTSNPSVMVAAGLLAKKAVEKGLTVPPHVKTSLAPGSRVVTDYFEKAGLDKYLEKVGFYTVGYGCTTCIGNSGPLPEPISQAVKKNDLVVAGVLSGNRNFEGRINPDVKANYLASPPLVVAYALAGTTDIDFEQRAARRRQGRRSPSTCATSGRRTPKCRRSSTSACCPRCSPSSTTTSGTRTRSGTRSRRAKASSTTGTPTSTYIQEPPFLVDLPPQPGPIQPIRGARCLAALGDSVTTDHISPAGSIAKDSPAGKYLMSLGVEPRDFNSYGARRGNDRVMTRGTFANIRIRNLLAPGTEGGVTRHLPDGDVDVDLRRRDEVQSRRRAAGRARRRRIRQRLQPRLGRQGAVPARRAGRARRQLRTHPPQQPGGDGHPAAGVRRRTPPGNRSASPAKKCSTFPTLDDNLQAAPATEGRRHEFPTATARNSRRPCASTRRSSSTTTATAAFCRRCCGSC